MATGIVYLLGDLIGGLITADYSFVENAVSELSQAGATHRYVIVPFLLVHALMLVVFGYVIALNHPSNRSRLVFSGGLIIMVIGVCHSLSGTIFPQDPVGDPATFAGTMHLILVGITVILIFLLLPIMGLGLHRLENWKGFRIFSFVCLPIMIAFGALTPFMMDNGMMGVAERVVGYTFYIWTFVLAYLFIAGSEDTIASGNQQEVESQQV